jgi:hypothetical protein
MPAARGHSSGERASKPGDGARYEIVVRGQLGRALSVWFSEMEIRPSGSDEISIVGYFKDQAALQGFLVEMGDFGLELSSVRTLTDEEAAPDDDA